MIEEEVKHLKEASLDEKREIVSNLGIYELRGFARALGVMSPTTKKRDFLIESILDALNNDTIEISQKVGKGRPFKKLESIDNILNIMNDNNVKNIEIPKSYTYEDIAMFAQEIPVFEYNCDEDIEKRTGILRVVKNTAYFIDFETNVVVFMPNEMIKKYSLANGDLIEAVAYKINESNQYCVKKIVTINKVTANEYKANIEEDLNKTIPNIRKLMGDNEVVFGGRNVVITHNPLFLENNLTDIINNFGTPENNVILLGVNLCAEDLLILQNYTNIIQFTSEYGKNNISKNFDKIIDSINFCDRLMRLNNNVVFVIYDIMNIANVLDVYFSSGDGIQIQGHYQQTIVIIQKLISLASAYSNGKDCTSLITCNIIDIQDPFIRNEVLKISNITK